MTSGYVFRVMGMVLLTLASGISCPALGDTPDARSPQRSADQQRAARSEKSRTEPETKAEHVSLVGSITQVQGDAITVAIRHGLAVTAGTKLGIYSDIPDLGLAKVGDATVTAVVGDLALGKVARATGAIKPGQNAYDLSPGKSEPTVTNTTAPSREETAPQPPDPKPTPPKETPPRDTTAEDLKKIQGRWQIDKEATDGRGASYFENTVMVFDGERAAMIQVLGDSNTRATEGTFKIDGKLSPGHFDWTYMAAGQLPTGDLRLYAFQDDRLVMATNRSGDSRPANMKDAQLRLTYKRMARVAPPAPEEAGEHEVSAFRKQLELAEDGDAYAQHKVSTMYRQGTGVVRDAAEALLWCRKAADQGLKEALADLAEMYWQAEGATRYPQEAVKLHRRAALKGSVPAMVALAEIYASDGEDVEDEEEATAWLRRAAEAGHAASQYDLGKRYKHGEGFDKDVAQACQWFRKAANNGHDAAQNDLGWHLFEGVGIAKDQTEAVTWYRKAADQGLAGAQVNLGFAYLSGQGVSKDYTQAYQWYKKAADQRYALGQYNVGVMYAEGLGRKQNGGVALQWLKVAADQDLGRAHNYIGVMYQRGMGVTANKTEAIKWYRQAAQLGYETAFKNLKALGAKLPTLHVVIASQTNDEKSSEARKIDVSQIRAAIEMNVPKHQLSLQTVTDDQFCRRGIFSALEQIDADEVDALAVFIVCHGAYDQIGHFLGMPDHGRLYRGEIVNAIAKRGAGLDALITHSCNVVYPRKTPIATGQPYQTATRISPLFQSLFFEVDGLVDFNGASDGEVGLSNQGLGSTTFHALSRYLRDHRERSINWSVLIREFRAELHTEFRRWCPDGRDRGDDVQLTQSPRVWSLPPGYPELQDAVASGRGYRLGIYYGNNYGNGVIVQRVMDNAAVEDSPLDRGDIIYSVNGTKVRSIEGMSKAIRWSPLIMSLNIRDSSSGRTGNLKVQLAY